MSYETIAKVAVHTPEGIVTLGVPCTVDESGLVTYELPEHLMRFEERTVLDVMGPDIDMSAFDSIDLKPFSSSDQRMLLGPGKHPDPLPRGDVCERCGHLCAAHVPPDLGVTECAIPGCICDGPDGEVCLTAAQARLVHESNCCVDEVHGVPCECDGASEIARIVHDESLDLDEVAAALEARESALLAVVEAARAYINLPDGDDTVEAYLALEAAVRAREAPAGGAVSVPTCACGHDRRAHSDWPGNAHCFSCTCKSWVAP